MSLKYYSDEANRYGPMGTIDAATMNTAMEKACDHFGVPRIELKFATTWRRASWYRGGLGMIANNLALYAPLSLPTIKMAPNHMFWRMFCHEFAHHIHICRVDAKWRDLANKAGLDTVSTTTEVRGTLYRWLIKNAKKEHAHGPTHRTIMQEVVNFFMGNGMITVKPTYMEAAAEIATTKLAA